MKVIFFIKDINECILNMGNCGKNFVCLNTVGSYLCICKPGLIFNFDTFICEKNKGYLRANSEYEDNKCPKDHIFIEIGGRYICM